MIIEPVRKVNVTKQVFDQMLDIIYQNQWKVGERLPSEAELCDLFGVSRVTIRQAIQKLVALDLVETRHGEGSFVKAVSPGNSMNALMPDLYLRTDEDTLSQILEYREIIEVHACRLAALRQLPEDLVVLENIVNEMEHGMAADDQQAFAQADIEFHLHIARMTRNSIVIKIHEILTPILVHAMQDTIVKMGYLGLWYHKEIVAAFAEKDIDKATTLMKEHLSNNWRFLAANGNTTSSNTTKSMEPEEEL